ncbi:amidase domain-containing protein [Ornithinibacillus sp. 4-3]|uniref:Amidase domain-containing protein n=1 Tax=Ornithinibacillus sp. 4-3 TaxID=3231488 RepID=A0AB39HVL7_9BACI
MDNNKNEWLKLFAVMGGEDWWERKKLECEERGVEIIKLHASAQPSRQIKLNNEIKNFGQVYLRLLIQQEGEYYHEERIMPYLTIRNNEGVRLVSRSKQNPGTELNNLSHPYQKKDSKRTTRFVYDRFAAVQYAERWWNSYNPQYEIFEVDCTNYVSQCLFAGGAPMHGYPNRSQGWWYQNNQWSFSWSVAHSMRWYLSGAENMLFSKEVESAQELNPGDVICYDFEGDGRFDHTTIVVAKDANDMPLVNAHTNNSRHRYWTYQDSLAWTPETQYKFFRIGET